MRIWRNFLPFEESMKNVKRSEGVCACEDNLKEMEYMCQEEMSGVIWEFDYF